MNRGKVLMAGCVALLCASCGKQSAGSFAAQSSAPGGHANSPLNDYSKPYLTDDKVQRLINSMHEEKNPFDFLFGKSGKAANLAAMATAVPELEAFAREYGFQGYEDYTAVWGRVVAGQAAMMAEDMLKGARESMQSSIQNAQAEVKEPDLSPEMRKRHEDQISGAQQSLDKPSEPNNSALNDISLALVKKYNDQINEAEKKYSAQIQK